MKEIIEKLKKGTDLPLYNKIKGLYSVGLTRPEVEQIIQALEEQPFCDSCEHPRDMLNLDVCTNEESYLFECPIDTTTSCIHHSGRREKK